jgi:hypothetical protein
MQRQVPCTEEDHDKFKQFACARKMSMKEFFHEIIIDLGGENADHKD